MFRIIGVTFSSNSSNWDTSIRNILLMTAGTSYYRLVNCDILSAVMTGLAAGLKEIEHLEHIEYADCVKNCHILATAMTGLVAGKKEMECFEVIETVHMNIYIICHTNNQTKINKLR